MKIRDEESSSDNFDDTRMSLIELAQANEPSAWELVFTLYAPLIKRWAYRTGVKCPHEAENVCQEVFAKLVKNLPRFRQKKAKGSFRSWLRVITQNYVYTNYLGNTEFMTIGGSEWHYQLNQIPFDRDSVNSLLDSVSDEHSDEKSILFRQIMTWIDSEFSPVQRKLFKRVVIDQRPPREVAEDLKITVNVVYQNKSRILARIREVFQDLV